MIRWEVGRLVPRSDTVNLRKASSGIRTSSSNVSSQMGFSEFLEHSLVLYLKQSLGMPSTSSSTMQLAVKSCWHTYCPLMMVSSMKVEWRPSISFLKGLNRL